MVQSWEAYRSVTLFFIDNRLQYSAFHQYVIQSDSFYLLSHAPKLETIT